MVLLLPDDGDLLPSPFFQVAQFPFSVGTDSLMGVLRWVSMSVSFNFGSKMGFLDEESGSWPGLRVPILVTFIRLCKALMPQLLL